MSWEYKILFTAANHVTPVLQQIAQEFERTVQQVRQASGTIDIKFRAIDEATPVAQLVQTTASEIPPVKNMVFQGQDYASPTIQQVKTVAEETAGTYQITFVATDQATPVAQQISQQIGQIEEYSMEAQWSISKLGTISTRTFRSILFSAQMGLFYFSMFKSASYRNEAALLSLESAQERYTEAIRKYGSNSQEAVTAARQLQRAQLYYQRTVQQSNLMTLAMSLQMVSFGATLVQTIPQITKFIATLKTLNVTLAVTKALSSPWGWVGLGIAVAGIAGAYAYMASRPPELPSTLNINTRTDLDEVLEEYKRRLKRAIQQGGSP